jgi:hypothetical protein
VPEEESKGKKEEDSSANPSKTIHWNKIPFSTARFAFIRLRPWHRLPARRPLLLDIRGFLWLTQAK